MLSVSKRTIIGGAIGNALETYDYVIWGLFSVYLSKEFLPPNAKLSDIFFLFLLTYILRPIGSLVGGILADSGCHLGIYAIKHLNYRSNANQITQANFYFGRCREKRIKHIMHKFRPLSWGATGAYSDEVDHRFRRKWITDSDASGSLIPNDVDHPERSDAYFNFTTKSPFCAFF